MKTYHIKEIVDYSDLGGNEGDFPVTSSNIDDVFRALVRKGIKRIKVNIEEMLIIAEYMAWNGFLSTGTTKRKLLKTIKEKKVKEFMGIKLILEENGKTK